MPSLEQDPEGYEREMAIIRGGGPPRTLAPGRRFPCPHEGPVVEPCNGCGAAWRHVRVCLFDGHDYERCVRGQSGNADVQSCSSCQHHPDAEPPAREA